MSIKILAVDDDKGTLEFYRMVFEDAGFTIQTAEDALSAILTCVDLSPDILLLDWDMPGGGGKRAYTQICEQVGKALPVLFITGTTEKMDIPAVPDKVIILKKPANIATLLSHIGLIIKGL